MQYLLATTVDTDGDLIADSSIDINNDGAIQNSEALLVTGIWFEFNPNTNPNNISDLAGMENFNNLEVINIRALGVQVVDFSIWPNLEDIDLSGMNREFTLNNLNLKKFRGGTTNSNNLIDFTGCPNLEEVTITTSSSGYNSVLFSTHPSLTSLNLTNGSYLNLDLTGLNGLKNLIIGQYDGQTLDFQSQTDLESLIFNYTSNLTTVIGLSSMPFLEFVDINYVQRFSMQSNLDLTFDGSKISNLSIYGINDLTIVNNSPINLDYDIRFINGALTISDVDITPNVSFNNATIRLYADNINSIDIVRVHNLQEMYLYNYNTQNLDLSHVDFSELNLNNCNISELNIKNGQRFTRFSSGFNNLLDFVCVNAHDEQIVRNGLNNLNQNTGVHPYCTFVLGGSYYEVEGNVTIDFGSGCTLNPNVDRIGVQFTITDLSNSDFFYPNSSNQYSYSLPDGQHTITPNPENPTYWNFSPPNVVVDFPTQSSPFTQDFCVTANGTIEDLEVIVVPLEQARPGFDTDYKVVIKNKGNQTASGSVTLDFEDDFMTLLSTNPMAGNTPSNQLSWSFSGLQPFQMEEYEFTMTLNTPTQSINPLNSNDILTFTGTVTGTGTDAIPADNVMVFDQTVVNSYDPNDKTCLEGETITPAMVGEYVHYMIRFENTGTASAINVVIKDEIDLSQFDITTLIPLGGSDDYYTRIREGNVVEFIHENINLDFNDATNDGHVLFKIKTLTTLTEGDTFDNTAEIYFDFNFPIITNTETVTVTSTASLGETTDTSISVYPNPARNFITISSLNYLKSATLIDVNGRTLSQTNFTGNTLEQRLSLENLSSGAYFVTIQSDLGQRVEKVIVE